MADGTVSIAIKADDADAQKKLNQLRKSIEKTVQQLQTSGEKRNAISESLANARAEAQKTAEEIKAIKDEMSENQRYLGGVKGNIDVDEFNARSQAQKEMAYELSQQEKAYSKQIANVQKLEQDEQKITQQLQKQEQLLNEQKDQAGDIERVAARQSDRTAPKLTERIQALNTSVKKGALTFLKFGLGIRSVYALFRRLRSAIKEGITSFSEFDDETKANIKELKSSLSTLKTSWGGAFAQILNAVAPILRTLISMLIEAGNAVSAFFAALSGKSSYKKVIQNNESLANSYESAGGAAGDAKKQVMGFDELNKLEDKSGGGGGGSASATVDEGLSPFFSSLQTELLPMMDTLKVDVDDLTKSFQKWWNDPSFENFVALFRDLFAVITDISKIVNTLSFDLVFIPVADFIDKIGKTFGMDLKLGDSMRQLKDDINGLMDAVQVFVESPSVESFKGILESIGNIGVTVAKTIWNFGSEVTKGLWSLIEKAASAVWQWLAELPGRLGYWLGVLGAKTLLFGQDIAKWFRELPHNLYVIATEKIPKLIEDIWEFLKKLPEKALELGENIIEGLWDGINAMGEWLTQKIQDFFDGFIRGVKDTLGIHSPSTVFEEVGDDIVQGLWNGIQEKWDSFISFFEGLWNRLKSWWDGLSLGAFHIPSPHFSWTYSEASGLIAKALEFVGLPATIPHLNISWYARGGIVDAPTLLGAGEAGKEAIVPLERNTEWINMVADGLVDRIAQSNRLADAISNLEPPALLRGQIVPPRAIGNGGSIFSDADIDRLVNGIVSAFGTEDNERETRLYLDGKVIAEAVTKYQRRAARGIA